MTTSGTIRTGIGGWVFEPWDKSFYPDKLAKTKQLNFASRQLTTIEINGTYYRGQSPKTFAKWAADVPEGFVFSLKGHRATTNRKVLAESEKSVAMFFASGVAELGNRLGPILWQFMPTKKFDPDDFEDFLKLLPETTGGLPLRHVLEVRHPSFVVPEFPALARRYGAAICYAHHADYPEMADVTANFVYARLQRGDDANDACYAAADLDAWAARTHAWAAGSQPDDLPRADPAFVPDAKPRDVFVYFIHEGKVHAPHGAMALLERMTGG